MVKRIEVKLPDELHAKFKGYCAKKHRFMHGQLLWMIEKAVEGSFGGNGQKICEVATERRKYKDRRTEDTGGDGGNRREAERRQSFLAPSSFEEDKE